MEERRQTEVRGRHTKGRNRRQRWKYRGQRRGNKEQGKRKTEDVGENTEKNRGNTEEARVKIEDLGGDWKIEGEGGGGQEGQYDMQTVTMTAVPRQINIYLQLVATLLQVAN